MIIDKFILLQYLKGELSEADVLLVEEWYESSIENQKELESLYCLHFLDERLEAYDNINVENALADFKEIVRAKANSTARLQRKMLVAVAASFVIGIGLAWLGLRFVSGDLLMDYAYHTKMNEKTQVWLPDGSKVWLNGETDLHYERAWWGGRRVRLEGEAYFEVVHDRWRPFQVQVNGARVEVVGTKFNLRAKRDEQRVVTSLLQGVVVVDAAIPEVAHPLTLHPGQEFIVDIKTKQSHLNNVFKSADVLSWIEGKLVFKDRPLGDIAAVLERHYDVKFLFADDRLKNKRFTCEFDINEPVSHIVNILSLTRQIKYKQQDKEFLLSH